MKEPDLIRRGAYNIFDLRLVLIPLSTRKYSYSYQGVPGAGQTKVVSWFEIYVFGFRICRFQTNDVG